MSSIDLESSLIAGIAAWVEVETPSNHPEAVDSLLTRIRTDLDGLGAVTEFVHPAPFCAGVLLARFNPGAAGPRILLLGHIDTVHPIGTKEGPLRVRVENRRLYGPGVLDMKGGDYFAFRALAAMVTAGDLPPSPITLMLVPDEERGSVVSRPLIEAEAARHDCVLVPEPARSGYTVTGRYAFARYVLTTSGRPAHAGADTAAGRSAIRAMAKLIDDLESRTDTSRLISYSVGVVHGGEFANVVPTRCTAELLAVASSAANLAEVQATMRTLASPIPDVGLEVTPGPERPLFLPSPDTEALYACAVELGRDLGLTLKQRISGGGSDGNFTGAMGVPTLDGLGPAGEGPHTLDEHIEIASLAPRALLFERLIRAVAAGRVRLN